MQHFDAIIIGSGQAGTPLLGKLSEQNYKIAFIEKNKLGGTCVNVGCTPTKIYVASARRMWESQHGDELGIEIPPGSKANLQKIKARKDKHIQSTVNSMDEWIANDPNVTFFSGIARFKSNKVVEVNGESLSAPEIYINVGGKPYVPEGFKDVPFLTNESILELEDLPEHLIVVGGSYIGLEFGQMFKRFGSKVSIIEKSRAIVNREDPETSERIQEFLEKEDIYIRKNADCLSGFKNDDDTVSVKADCAEDGIFEFKGSHVLLAVGRRPNTDKLGLENTDIKMNSRGFIEVNDYLETNVEGIYALGDCNGKGAFTHTSYNDYEIIAENKFEAKDRKVSDRHMIYGLFIDPPLGRVGMTKTQAEASAKNILYAHRPMSRISRAKEKGETYGYMSAVIDADTNKFLGATVLGTGGDEIISTFSTAMYANADYQILRDSVQAHPTVSELIPTLLETLERLK